VRRTTPTRDGCVAGCEHAPAGNGNCRKPSRISREPRCCVVPESTCGQQRVHHGWGLDRSARSDLERAASRASNLGLSITARRWVPWVIVAASSWARTSNGELLSVNQCQLHVNDHVRADRCGRRVAEVDVDTEGLLAWVQVAVECRHARPTPPWGSAAGRRSVRTRGAGRDGAVRPDGVVEVCPESGLEGVTHVGFSSLSMGGALRSRSRLGSVGGC